MLRGIAADGKITEDECKNLMQWLYDNMHLADHFPFNQTFTLLEKVLEDSIITTEESQYINTMISQMLDPVNALHSQINSIEGTHICLSGVFDYGEKSKVEEYIVERGGFIDSSVKKTTDILLIGGLILQVSNLSGWELGSSTNVSHPPGICDIPLRERYLPTANDMF